MSTVRSAIHSIFLVPMFFTDCDRFFGGPEGEEPPAMPSDAGRDEPFVIDDDTPPTIVWSNVADGDDRVSVLVAFEIVMSEPLDDDTLSAENITLIDYDGDRVPAEITYDDGSGTILFAPLSPLRYRSEDFPVTHYTKYELSFSGVADLAGNEMSPTTIAFATYTNPVTRIVQYTTGTEIVPDPAGWFERTVTQIAWHLDYRILSNGEFNEATRYPSAGIDGEWLTCPASAGT